MRKSRLDSEHQKRLMEHFVAGTTARTAASLTGVNNIQPAITFNVCARSFIRPPRILLHWLVRSKWMRVIWWYRKGKRGRGAAGKVPVFGLLKRGGKVYTKVIPDTKGATLKAIMEDRIVPDRIVYSDTYRSYNVLDVSAFKHYRINHSKLFADRKNHINGIENFWNQAKRHMRRFNGVSKATFPLFFEGVRVAFQQPKPQNAIIPVESMG